MTCLPKVEKRKRFSYRFGFLVKRNWQSRPYSSLCYPVRVQSTVLYTRSVFINTKFGDFILLVNYRVATTDYVEE